MSLTTNHAAHLAIATIELFDYLDAEAERVAALFDKLVERIVVLGGKYTGWMLQDAIRREIEGFDKQVGKRAYEALLNAGNASASKSIKALRKSLPPQQAFDINVKEAVGGAILQAILKPFQQQTGVIATIRSRITDLLIEPIKKHVLEKIILGGAAAISRMMTTVKQGINPQKVADVLARDISDGKDRRAQIRNLQNELAMPRAAAKRTVRTEGIRVATESNMAAYEELGGVTIGFMVHAVLDSVTRPEHRERNGTVYYKFPEADQKGIQDMPRPPIEPDGTTAFNCRCYLQPIFPPIDDIDTASFAKVLPAIVVYEDWWKTATDRKKRVAVGVRRFNFVTSQHGQQAGYEYFINDKGELMDIADLQAETAQDTAARVKANRDRSNAARARRASALAVGSV